MPKGLVKQKHSNRSHTLPANVAKAISDSVSSKKDVLAAYVFGSVAAGRARKGSDIDIAVLLRDTMSRPLMFQYRLNLIADIGAELRRSDVDVVILNEAPPLLAHRVLSLGKLIFERSASARIRFQVMTANRYADMVPAYETYLKYLKKSIREGRIIG
jgi:predicted nucleotidyltransferase